MEGGRSKGPPEADDGEGVLAKGLLQDPEKDERLGWDGRQSAENLGKLIGDLGIWFLVRVHIAVYAMC